MAHIEKRNFWDLRWQREAHKKGVLKPKIGMRVPEKIREQIFLRDNSQCQYCNTKQRLSIDLIIPWTKGGTNDLSNLQVLCLSCNCRKKDL